MSAALAPAEEIVVKADRVAHVLVLKEVYLNGQGPFRMMVDTGASSCMARPAVARKLGLKAAYAVESETVAGVKRVSAAVLDEVRVGPVSDGGIEVLAADLHLSGVDGVLGQSWLARHDYLLDYRGRRLVLNPAEPGGGVRTALRSGDGRPQIAAEVDGLRQDLVLDSGASGLVLFGRSRLGSPVMVGTNSGSVGGWTGTSRIKIGGGYSRLMAATTLDSTAQPGLLPAVAFASVYVSNRDGVVVLVP